MEASLSELLENPLIVQLLGLSALILACVFANYVMRRFVLPGIGKLILRSETDWDDVLLESDLFERFAPLLPAVIGLYGVRLLPGAGETLETVVGRIAVSVIILVLARVMGAFLTGANELYSRRPQNRDRPIKGYVQVANIVISIIAAVLILATLLDRSPLIFLSGIGAMAAVLLLVFRDTILSLVASVQITSQDMVRVGDWIEMPQFGADGDVIDVALHTVKVQNWDKTITTIPTHRLITDSFKNWRFMPLSGGRRIKRALSIDMSSVRFLEAEEIERFGGFALLREYVAEKREELTRWNDEEGRNRAIDADIRRLTNLGTFRAYIERYLATHPKINPRLTLLVRQLSPTENGIPIEIYCFTNVTEWNAYEAVQADLFDHFLAIAGEFGLRAFQAPSGGDLTQLARSG